MLGITGTTLLPPIRIAAIEDEEQIEYYPPFAKSGRENISLKDKKSNPDPRR